MQNTFFPLTSTSTELNIKMLPAYRRLLFVFTEFLCKSITLTIWSAQLHGIPFMGPYNHAPNHMVFFGMEIIWPSGNQNIMIMKEQPQVVVKKR